MIILEQDAIIAALQKVIKQYGKPFAGLLECLFRNETAHFQSTEWHKCFSPGMEMVKDSSAPHYGWDSLGILWDSSDYGPIGIWSAVDNNSALSKSTGLQGFLQFPTVEAAFVTVAYHIHNNKKDNFGGWFSNEVLYQNQYIAILKTIIPRFVDSLPET